MTKAAAAKAWSLYNWPDGQRSYPFDQLSASGVAFAFSSSAAVDDGIAEGSFYQTLKGRSDRVLYRDYSTIDGLNSTQVIAEMDGDLPAGNPVSSNALVDFDASEDSAQYIFAPSTSTIGGNGMKIDHATGLSGDVLWVWEAKWSEGFNAASEDWTTHKTFVIRQGSPALRMFEVRNLYSASGVADNEAGRIDVRGYPSEGWDPTNGITGSDQIIGGTYTYDIPDGTWVRYFVYADYDAGHVSMWVHDELDTRHQIMDEIPFTFEDSPNEFSIQHNSSQGRSGANTVYAWVRRVTIHQDLTSTPESIFDASTW